MGDEYQAGKFGDGNNCFWDRPADERAAVMQAAADRGWVDGFFDLSPDERAQAYDEQ